MYIFTPNTLIKSSEVNSNFAELKTMTDYLTVPDTGWIEVGSGGTAPAFQNSWVNYDTTYNSCGFRKDALGYVHLKGLIKSGTIGYTIFTLPSGYRPAKRYLLSTSTNPNAYARLDIQVTGNVDPITGSKDYYSLDGITFKAEQ